MAAPLSEEYSPEHSNAPEASRFPSGEPLAGFIFVCNNETMDENMKQKLFSLPIRYHESVRGIQPGMPLFLYNCSLNQLHGVFEASSEGILNLSDSEETQSSDGVPIFPVQVRVRLRESRPPLPDSLFRPVMNYYEGHKFKLELSVTQVDKLLQLFDMVDETDEPAEVSSKHPHEDFGGQWEHVKSKSKSTRLVHVPTQSNKSAPMSSNRRANSPVKWRTSATPSVSHTASTALQGGPGNHYNSFGHEREGRRGKGSGGSNVHEKPKPDRTDAPRWRSDPESWGTSAAAMAPAATAGKIETQEEDNIEGEPKKGALRNSKEHGKRNQHKSNGSMAVAGATVKKAVGAGRIDSSDHLPAASNDNATESAKPSELTFAAAKAAMANGDNSVRPVSFVSAALRGLTSNHHHKGSGRRSVSNDLTSHAAEGSKNISSKKAASGSVEAAVNGPTEQSKAGKSAGKGKHGSEKATVSSKLPSQDGLNLSAAMNPHPTSKGETAAKKVSHESNEHATSFSAATDELPTAAATALGNLPSIPESNKSHALPETPLVVLTSTPRKPAWKGDSQAILRGLSGSESTTAGNSKPQKNIESPKPSAAAQNTAGNKELDEDSWSEKQLHPTQKSDSSLPRSYPEATNSESSKTTSVVPSLTIQTEPAESLSTEHNKDPSSHSSNAHPLNRSNSSARRMTARSPSSSSSNSRSTADRNTVRKVAPAVTVDATLPSQVPIVQFGAVVTAPLGIPTAAIATVHHHQPHHHHHPYPQSHSQPQSPQGQIPRLTRNGFDPSLITNYRPFPLLSPLVGFPTFPMPHPGQLVNAAAVHDEIVEYSELVRPSKMARVRAEAAVDCVRVMVKSLWPSAEVEVFGSFATGLALPNSDVDVAIINAPLPPSTPETMALNGARVNAPLIRQLAAVLQNQEWCASMHTIETARIPVIKLKCQPKVTLPAAENSNVPNFPKVLKLGAPRGASTPTSLVAMDITIAGRHQNVLDERQGKEFTKEWIGKLSEANMAHNGEAARDFVKDKLQALPALAPLVLLLKAWLQHRGLNDVYTGGLGSFALTLLVVFYLERAPVSIGTPSVSVEVNSSSQSSERSSPRDGIVHSSHSQEAGGSDPAAISGALERISEGSGRLNPVEQPLHSVSAPNPSKSTTTSHSQDHASNSNLSPSQNNIPHVDNPGGGVGGVIESTDNNQHDASRSRVISSSSGNNSQIISSGQSSSSRAGRVQESEAGKQEALLNSQHYYPVTGVPMFEGNAVQIDSDNRSKAEVMMPHLHIIPAFAGVLDTRVVLKLPEYRRRKINSIVEKLPFSIRTVPTPNFGVLLVGVLQAFGYEFDFGKVRLVLKNKYGGLDGVFWHEATQRPTALWIDDPLRPGANIGAGSFAITTVQAAFRDLLFILRTPDPQGYSNSSREGGMHNDKKLYFLDKAFNSAMSPPDPGVWGPPTV